jgi:hypothetical protein
MSLGEVDAKHVLAGSGIYVACAIQNRHHMSKKNDILFE